MFENFEYEDGKFSMGFDPKFKTDNSKMLKEIIIDFIIDGYSTSTISNALCKELKFKAMYANALCSKCYKEYMRLNKNGRDDLLDKNVSRLNRIYRKCMEEGDTQNALKAIDLLNKLGNGYSQKLEIATTEFKIDLNGEED